MERLYRVTKKKKSVVDSTYRPAGSTSIHNLLRYVSCEVLLINNHNVCYMCFVGCCPGDKPYPVLLGKV